MTAVSHPEPATLGVPKTALISERVGVALLAVFVCTVALLTVTPWPVGAFQDDATYTVLAKSLAEGHGFRMLNLPGEPNATHFPPGYPLVLAALWKLSPRFPENIVLFKFANAFFLAAAAVGAYWFTRRRFGAGQGTATALALVGTLSIVVILITGVIMSEPLFMAVLFPALLWSERAVESGKWRDAALAGVLLGVLTLVRTIGVFAIPAVGLVLLLRRQWLSIVALGVGSALFVGPWQLWVGAHQHEIAPVMVGKFGSYGQWLVDGYRAGGVDFALGVIQKNAAELYGMLSYGFMPVQTAWPRVIVMAAMVGFAILGTKRFYRSAPASLVFLGLYTLVVMLWPFEPSRFLLAVWPMWPLLLGCGVLAAWEATAGPQMRLVGRPVVAILALAVAGGWGYYNSVGYTRKWWVTAQRDAGERAKPIVEWAARYTSPTDVLSTEDDLIVYLYAGRKAVPTSTFTALQRLTPLTDAQDVQVVREIFAAYNPRWFIVGSQQGDRTARALMADSAEGMRYVGRTPHVQIFQRTLP